MKYLKKALLGGGGKCACFILLIGCTGQIPGSFRFLQQEELFDASFDFNTKIDMLWVIDNSASMDVSQKRLRDGFLEFADKYMQPTWDIRVAVITSDTFLANPAYVNFYDDTRGGIRMDELRPLLGPNYARLLPGIHDGPITSKCVEENTFFYFGVNDCQIRDDTSNYNGITDIDRCLNPDEGAGETSMNQCVNTDKNDTIRSGKAVIETMPPAGVEGDDAWRNQLIRDMVVNLSVGSSGDGSERGFQSTLQFLFDNEPTETAFFRADSLRAIVFISDEEEQSMNISANPPGNLTPSTYYSSSCPSKTVDELTYTIYRCPDESRLIPVSDFKSQLDQFFLALDGNLEGGNPNYFVAGILPLSGDTIAELQAERDIINQQVGIGAGRWAVDRGDRYIDLINEVGDGSFAMEIASTSYSPILDRIGQTLVNRRGEFALKRAPSEKDEMTITILKASGERIVIQNEQYELNENVIRILDENLILSLTSSDQFLINYQPGSFEEF